MYKPIHFLNPNFMTFQKMESEITIGLSVTNFKLLNNKCYFPTADWSRKDWSDTFYSELGFHHNNLQARVGKCFEWFWILISHPKKKFRFFFQKHNFCSYVTFNNFFRNRYQQSKSFKTINYQRRTNPENFM